MTTAAVSELLYLLDAAFEGPDWHAVLVNIRDLRPDDWRWLPPGGERAILDIVQHVGSCKLMYENHAFGDARLRWDDPLVDGGAALETPATAVAWLRQAQGRLRRSVAALDDAELSRPRLTNWGELKETRWIIATMIQHDLYHAGEINHMRSLARQTDAWAYGG
jgi:uncharacterized damage-inducible protein DinB